MALLEINELIKDFGGLRAVDRLSLCINEGDIVGLIGPNGAGKTTAFNLITGFCQRTAGKVIFQGKNISGQPPERIAELGIVRTFQINSIFPQMSVIANVVLGFHIHSRVGFFGALFNTKNTQKREQELIALALEILNSLGIADLRSKLAGSLSHGHQRALEIAIALAAQPKLLLLDEPVSGMSRDEMAIMVNNMVRVRDMGINILIVEHDMKTIMDLCNKVVVLNHGRKIAEGAPQEICRDKAVIEAYLGTEEEEENFV